MNESPLPQGVEITQLLKRHQNGDPEALHQLIPHVYQELRRLAQHYFNCNRQPPSLSPTVLLHEAFLQLFDGAPIDWQNREHFFSVIRQKIRWLVVDHFRRTQAGKRGGQAARVSLEEIQEPGPSGQQSEDLLALNQALEEMERLYPRVGQIVELRYFVGLNEEQTAEVLKLSPRTVRRDWAFAKVWLLDRMNGAAGR